ncbi:MAG: transposase [Oscillospiraceae bacterium]
MDEVETQIKECIWEIDLPCLSLPGIGELSAAVILSEFGCFSKFDSPSKMLTFAGLQPGYFQSGQSEFTGHMVSSAPPSSDTLS